MRIFRNLRHLLSRSTEKSSSAFSAFFTEYPSKERKKILRGAAEAASADQRDLIEKYEKTIQSTN